MFDKVTRKVFTDAIIDRAWNKRIKNLRCIRLTQPAKDALIEGGWLTQTGHFYTNINTKIKKSI